MATPGREYSLDHHLLEHMKFSGMERQNLADLVSIVVSLKNKYGIVPLAAAAQGYPEPNALTVSYVIESITLNKILNVLLRHHHLARHPPISRIRRGHNPRRFAPLECRGSPPPSRSAYAALVLYDSMARRSRAGAPGRPRPWKGSTPIASESLCG